jgi:hypothetical protein
MKKMMMLGALVLSLFTVAQADLLVDFGTNLNYVTANANNQGRTGTPSAVPFSMTSVRSPAAGYTGPIFYGGATGSVAITTWVVAQSATIGDYISASGTSTGIGSRASALIMFTNQSATITQVVWSIRLGGTAANQTNAASIVVRKDDGLFYISETMSLASSGIRTNTNPEALAWYNYDPAASLNDRGSLVSGFTLDNVNAVGEWQEGVLKASTTFGAGINAFQAWGAVPEPATVGMLGLGALITLLIRRFRSR